MKSQLQSVRLTMGGALMKEGKLFEAADLFEQVKTPPGLYNLAQVKQTLCTVHYLSFEWSHSRVSSKARNIELGVNKLTLRIK